MGVTDSGGVQGKTRCCTWCHGLVDKLVFDHRLDSLIWEVFSNRIVPVILFIALAGQWCRIPGEAAPSAACPAPRSEPVLSPW